MTDVTTNPYAAPPTVPAVAPPPTLTILRGFGVVVAAAFGFGLAGALVGLLLGLLMPSYYRSVFDNFDNPGFVPWQVGLGLGLTQGTGAGIFIGASVLLATAWRHSRRA